MPSVVPPEVFVFAKEPHPGQVKTRLCPPLQAAQAARCHRAFAADTVARLSALADVRVVLAATPDRASPWLTSLARRFGVELVWQGPGELGTRMRRCLARAGREPAATAIVGTDSPDLPVAYVREALVTLEHPGTVIGPARDGGYYLIGCRGPVPPIFALEAAWGSSGVLSETLQRLRDWPGGVRLLADWWDVDDGASLAALAARLDADAADCLATRAVLAELRNEGVAL